MALKPTEYPDVIMKKAVGNELRRLRSSNT